MKIVIFSTQLEPNLHHMHKTIEMGIFPLLNLNTYEFIIQNAYESGFRDFVFLFNESVFETRKYLGDGTKYGIDLKVKSTKNFLKIIELVSIFRNDDQGILFVPWNYFLHQNLFQKLKLYLNNSNLQEEEQKKILFFQKNKDLSHRGPFYISSATKLNRILENLPQGYDKLNFLLEKGDFVDVGNSLFSFHNLQELWQLQLKLLYDWKDIINHSCNEIKPGIFLAPGVRLSVSNNLIQPLVIGRESILEPNTIIGINAILGEGTLVGSRSSISNSLIFKNTHIGEGLDIKNSFVIYNFIYNYETNSIVSIPDNFLLKRSNNINYRMPLFLEKIITSILLFLFFIPYNILKIYNSLFNKSNYFKQVEIFILDDGIDLAGNRNKISIKFMLLDIKYLPLRLYGLLWYNLLGRIRLVGNSYSINNSNDLIYPSGIFNLCDAESKESASDEQRLISDLFYKKLRKFTLDLKIILLSLFTRKMS
ncbi:MAG: hypothetical protein CK427_10365 [Leptospira sp.]|nr:MAG: hypothetical protein CK427_10365 [Leptospira sp.]